MTETDNIIIDATARIFQELGDPQTLNNAPDDAWREPLWAALEESGLTLAWVPDDLGGAGADISDGFDILQTAGRFAVAVPLAETLLAGWALSKANLQVPQGAMSLALSSRANPLCLTDGKLAGRAEAVPFASGVDHFVALAETPDGAAVIQIDAAACNIETAMGIGGDPQGNVRFDGAAPAALAPAPAGIANETLMLMGAAARSTQMAGALQGILELAVDYAGERVAFGRPIAKFQAVQHNLAQLAGETAAAVAAAGSAADSIHHADNFNEAVFFEVAAAKTRAGEAAGEGAAIAHQVHGAIGFTDEHILHRFTRRLWAWRDDFGSESEWAVGLGALVAANGADQLWPMVASR